MNWSAAVIAAVALGGLCPAPGMHGMSLPGRAGALTLRGSINCPVVPSSGGTACLQLTLAARPESPSTRRPLNLCVVLDRSGSMAEEGKIASAKAALGRMIDLLGEGDIFSLVIYDDVVEVLRSASPVTDRRRLHDLVEGIQPRGWTNLGGGMQEGFRQAERYAGEDRVSRVVLLSDGLANRGITDPAALGRIARMERDRSISLTTIGMGLDYNENLMCALAADGGGNYYFIERSGDLASIFRGEFRDLGAVVAQNAVIILRTGPGVRITDVVGAPFTAEDGTCRIRVGDVAAGQCRSLTAVLDIPPGCGSLEVVRGEVRSEQCDGKTIVAPLAAVRVRFSDDAAAVERGRDLETQARADIALSTRGVERAMQALDEGKAALAERELAAAGAALAASPAASTASGGGAIRAQEARLDSFRHQLKDSAAPAGKAKKAIQYENYRTQRDAGK
ncbi:MAG TPA: VWA domain-containing protein [Bacteroidota bacterium]|nr:VWA domain-containing protein [Bacteroidota bacterium]